MQDYTSMLAYATVALAIATVGLAVITAYHEQIQSLIRHPTLVVSYVHDRPDSGQTRILQPRSFEFLAYVYYVRLRVTNEGKRSAEGVEVIASELFKQHAGGEFKRVDEFLPMNLKWTHTGQPIRPFIAPDTYRHCDLFHIIEPAKRGQLLYEQKTWPETDPSKTIISFDTEVQPNNLSHLMQCGTYRLSLIVASHNAKQVRLTVRITVTGEWYDDERRMFADGFHVKVEN